MMNFFILVLSNMESPCQSHLIYLADFPMMTLSRTPVLVQVFLSLEKQPLRYFN